MCEEKFNRPYQRGRSEAFLYGRNIVNLFVSAAPYASPGKIMTGLSMVYHSMTTPSEAASDIVPNYDNGKCDAYAEQSDLAYVLAEFARRHPQVDVLSFFVSVLSELEEKTKEARKNSSR